MKRQRRSQLTERNLQWKAGKYSYIYEEINFPVLQIQRILISKLSEISWFSFFRKKKKKKRNKFKLMRVSGYQKCAVFPSSVFLSSTGTPKTRQCKGLLCGPQRLYRLWTQWRNISICPMACGSSLLRLPGARGSRMMAVRA